MSEPTFTNTSGTNTVTGSGEVPPGKHFILAGGTVGTQSSVHIYDSAGNDACTTVVHDGTCPLNYGRWKIKDIATQNTQYSLGTYSNGDLTVGSG